jgi:hypothetical protein
MAVEIFKTDITEENAASNIVSHLQQLFPKANFNFDLQDCDNILRLESDYDIIQPTIAAVKALGFYCELLV